MSTGSAFDAWLRGLDVAGLERVLAARPDVLVGLEPRSLGELADRLQRPVPVLDARSGLTLPQLQAAEALAALGPVRREALARLLDATDGERGRALDGCLAALSGRALVWPGGDGRLHMVVPLRHAWEAPLGLDAPLAELLGDAPGEVIDVMLKTLAIDPPPGGDGGRALDDLVRHHADMDGLAAVIAQAPPEARRLLERRAREGPPPRGLAFHLGGRADSEPGARWAVDRALLVEDPCVGLRLPAEVALALRGPGWHAPFDPRPPEVPAVPVAQDALQRETAATATALVAHAAAILDACAAGPLSVLKSGDGVGVRELARIAKAARCDDLVVRVVLATTLATGLLARAGRRIVVTEACDAWLAAEPAERLATLLRAWLTLPRPPTQSRGPDGKPIPALIPRMSCEGCVQARHGLLAAAASLPAGHGARKSTGLGPLVTWHRPFADMPRQDAPPYATVIREAELLGLLVRGALSPIGAALLAETDPVQPGEALDDACRRLLPAAATAARFGSDLTAVVTSTPSAHLAALLDAVADREVGGVASVWRFSPGSIRRALDAGRRHEDIVAVLTSVAVGPLPQPLTYLIRDAARDHGRIRITTAACVIHAEESALLAELEVHRDLRDLRLRRLAPTVLIGRSPPEETLTAVRAAGYAPVIESPEGIVRIERSTVRRVAPGPVSAHGATRTDLRAMADRLLRR